MRNVFWGYQGRGVPPEARHFNPIILAVALEGALEQASDIIYEMASSEAESNLSPNVGSFNALMQVCSIAVSRFCGLHNAY